MAVVPAAGADVVVTAAAEGAMGAVVVAVMEEEAAVATVAVVEVTGAAKVAHAGTSLRPEVLSHGWNTDWHG